MSYSGKFWYTVVTSSMGAVILVVFNWIPRRSRTESAKLLQLELEQ